ncbi:MAG: adenylate/guanylate cyclase domain-containing protein [Chloroflexi bacterium]|nr:adenylate/guanylate cyclase domain-containing protein [Chloroflexota bacterium]
MHYARLPSGAALAYGERGVGVPVVIMPATVASQLDPPTPRAALITQPIAASGTAARILAYDHLGCGMSAREKQDYSPDGLQAELEAVLRDAQIDRCVLVATARTAPTAIRFTATHPDRVRLLALLRPALRGSDFAGAPQYPAYRAALEGDWVLASETVAAMAANTSGQERRDFGAALRAAVTQETFLEYLDATATHDATDAAGAVAVPTVVVGWEDTLFPARLGQDVARAIPGARLELVDSDRAAYVRAGELVASFLQAQAPDVTSADFRAILFTDVVASTPLLAQLKDARMREVMRDHDAVLQAAVDEYGGRVVKGLGDGFMVDFTLPSAAVECAIAMLRGIRAQFADSDMPIRLRIGINAGEPIADDDDLHGASVVIAKRLESAAPENGILVSEVVKQAVAGKDFEFQDQGEVDLKGFAEPVRAWSVEWA